MNAREKAMLAMWHRWGEGYTLDEFRAVLEQEGPPLLADLRRVLTAIEHDIEVGKRHFCSVCETIHPPVQDGQGLLLPKDPEQAKRVMNAHLVDEVRRAGPEGVQVGVVLSRLVGEAT